MFAIIAALAVAVFLSVAYAAVSERLDYATVGRRQLDAWVAVTALVLVTFIVFQAVDVAADQARVHRTNDATDGYEGGVALVRRIGRPDLSTPQLRSSHDLPDAPSEVWTVRHPDVAEASPTPAEPSTTAEGRSSTSDIERVPAAEDAVVDDGRLAPTPELVAGPKGGPSGPTSSPPTRTPGPNPWLIVQDTPTASVIQPGVEPWVPPTPTRIALVSPSPTPHCGEPSQIDASVELIDAEADRDDSDELVVRYTARLSNASTFPLQLKSVRVAALNRSGSSEQFGVDEMPDVTLPATDSLTVDGAVPLRKSPSPFGRTEVCISFVPETCGQRPAPNQRVISHCRIVTGF